MRLNKSGSKVMIVAVPIVMIMLVVTLAMMFQTRTEIQGEDEHFTDVPKDHWAYDYIETLRQKDITTGIGNQQFGLGKTMTRAEFVTFLVRLRGWDPIATTTATYTDNADAGTWYHDYIEVAAQEGVLDMDTSEFRPLEAITREEMAVMIANAIGFEALADGLDKEGSSFADVSEHAGAIELLKHIGIINGKGDQTYQPSSTALREEAAAILIRMSERMEAVTTHSNVFYAVSSYSQIDLAKAFDQVSFGWSELDRNDDNRVGLRTDFPDGYDTPLQEVVALGKQTALSVYGDDVNDDITLFLGSQEMQQGFIKDVSEQLEVYGFDGVVIDFEGMQSPSLQEPFNDFLNQLKREIGDKTLTVMVQPQAHYKGYDYRGIGDVADVIILMAHDFNAKRLSEADQEMGYTYTPITPIKQVYQALAALTDQDTGVSEEDRSKIGLQLSFATAQWEVDEEGKVLNERPYTPDYEKLLHRLEQNSTTVIFDEASMNPKALYQDSNTNHSYVIWYENATSIEKKVELAHLFGITRLSTWRLGNIPNPDANYPNQVEMEVVPILVD